MPPAPPPADGPIAAAYRRGSAHRHLDRGVARLAERQHGVVAFGQLLALGVGERSVHRRIEAGRLHAIHRGVYAVGHPKLTAKGVWMAAVLACGSRAALSHRSAAELWELLDGQRHPIDVTAPNRRGRSPGGIFAHRSDLLDPTHRDVRDGVPCTTVEKTLLDLAGVVPLTELRRAVAQAEVLRIFDGKAARLLIEQNRGRRGVARFRMTLDDIEPETRWSRSELERQFLGICSRIGLPRPEVNVLLDLGDVRFRPDFLWRDQRLIVEADSRRFHDTNSAFEADRHREQRLQMAGWRVSHCTWNQVRREPRPLGRRIRHLLQLRADGPKADG